MKTVGRASLPAKPSPLSAGAGPARHSAGWDLISPALLIIAVFVVLPCVWGIALSFTHFDGILPARFAGLANYRRMADDPLVRSTLWNTLLYVCLTLPTGLILSLAVALALNEKWFPGRSFARGIYFLPNITSLVAVAFVWEWLLNPEYGLINAGLRGAGLRGQGWLSDPHLAMPCVAMVAVWHGLGFSVLVYMAGLRSIPGEAYEAARIDGASAWQQFRYVTWPLLMPTTMFLTMMGVIGGFQVFQSVYIMTGGGPLDRTRVYLFYLWQEGFQNLEMGYASALAVLLFGIVLCLTLVEWRFFNRRLSTWQ
ncbi:MAG TPA: sugar ABC transporter permease [Armatimonadota bacterium]|jgi:multiple sugar transport system permease protein